MKETLKHFLDENIHKTIFSSLGIKLETLDGDETILSLNVDDRHRQHRGLVNGGVYVVLAESAASIAGASTVNYPEETVVGIEINANHVRACKEGKIYSKTKCLHKGKKTLVYEIYTKNEKDELLSVARCTLMVIKNIEKLG